MYLGTKEKVENTLEQFIKTIVYFSFYYAQQTQIRGKDYTFTFLEIVLQACVDLTLGSSLLDFECHFNETIEKKMR
ncbi:unnamed protein product [Camellia sinensis]